MATTPATRESNWLTGMFNRAGNWLWEGSWLQRQFQSAKEAVSPLSWVKSAAESVLGKDFLKAALGMVIRLFDSTPDNNADDGGFVKGLKSWRDSIAPGPQ